MSEINRISSLVVNKKTKKVFIDIPLTINTYDIDIAGHVNNIVYIKWFEDLRTKLFREYFDLPELLSNNLYPVVISTNITYKKFLKLFDKPVGFMNLVCYNHGIVTLKVEIRLDGKIAAFGEQKCILMNLKTSLMNKEKFKSILKA